MKKTKKDKENKDPKTMLFLIEEEDKQKLKRMESNYSHFMKEMLINIILKKGNYKN